MNNLKPLLFFIAAVLVLIACTTDKPEFFSEDPQHILEQQALKANGVRYMSVFQNDSVYGKYLYREAIIDTNGRTTKNAHYFEDGHIFLLDFYKYDVQNRPLKVINIDSFEDNKTIQTYDYSGNNLYRVDTMYSKGFLVEWKKYLFEDGTFTCLLYTKEGLKFKDLIYKNQTGSIDSIIRLDGKGKPSGKRMFFTYKNSNLISDVFLKHNDTLAYNTYNYNTKGLNTEVYKYYSSDGLKSTYHVVNEYENDLLQTMKFYTETRYIDGEKERDTTISTMAYQTSVPENSTLRKIDFPTPF